MIERIDNWTKSLNDLVEEVRFVPFEWGVHDCGTFASMDHLRITGVALIEAAMPRASLMDYMRFLVEDGNGLEGIMTKSLQRSADSSDWRQARRGDIVMIDSPNVYHIGSNPKYACAVSLGSNIACPGPNGLEFTTLQSVVKVWHIGS